MRAIFSAILVVLVGCSPDESSNPFPKQATNSVAIIHDETHLNNPGSIGGTWIYTVEIDGHKFAVSNQYNGVGICEVTDRSLVKTNVVLENTPK